MKKTAKTLSLGQLTLVASAILLLLLSVLFSQLYQASNQAVQRGSNLLVELEHATEMVEKQIRTFFSESETLLAELEQDGRYSALRQPGEELSQVLLTALQENEGMSEFTFTWEKGQISAFREPSGEAKLRRTDGPEPAQHRTYRTLVRPDLAGQAIWSDLHFSQLDSEIEQDKKRVVVTVQKAILHEGEVLGVARVGRSTNSLDDLAKSAPNVKWLFLSDGDGELLTRLKPEDRLVEGETKFRFEPQFLPSPVNQALKQISSADKAQPKRTVSKLASEDHNYIFAWRALPGTQDWYLGLIWSEDYFLAPLLQARRRMLVVATLVLLAAGFLVAGLLRRINRDLTHLVEATSQMRDFQFEQEKEAYFLSEMAEVSASLDGAKATLKAATKYLPLSLVKKLFSQDIRPELGGQMSELTLMFTDVVGFTTVSERLSTDELAQQLAAYLTQMNEPITNHEGDVLQRVGDALLAIWNAPKETPDHSTKACLAALACQKITEAHPWETRIGLHRDKIMVGHFGSTERMNYGVLGDGVNLASRVEGLNKFYGTSVLATNSVVKESSEKLFFRLIDRVAVKGKEVPVKLYELLGLREEVPEQVQEAALNYEKAFELYQERKFQEAIELLKERQSDRPSAVLHERCKAYSETNLDDDWDGVFRADFK